MRKSKTVVTENGAAYQLSNPVAWRLVYRVLGGVLVAMGILLAVVSPIGVACAAFGAAVAFWLPKKIQPTKKFLHFVGAPCAGCHTFGHWNPKVHSGQAQLERFEKAAHASHMAVLSYNAETGLAEIRGSGSDNYMTSLDECTCPDFDKRGRPCKHIYFLAIQMGYTSDDFYSC